MTTPRPRAQARANRARILEAAISAFAADPDASMDEVARAAGVVRRTVYSHFPNRDALVEGLVVEASTAIAEALAAGPPAPEAPELGVAVLALRTWPIGDRFRVLLSFARRELGDERIHDLLEPLRTASVGNVERGQREGVFSDYLPAGLLVAMFEGMTLTLLEYANRGAIVDRGETFATAGLVLLGLPPERAADVVERAARWLTDSGEPDVVSAG
ncbi:TetR/AcrR family transcriptional regulator [Prescottella agglutinans]|uniref:TetR/AcrR family transcriptional regulator of autoinduction and epiphytic fitness n=1 Tax=Prescottella agglutinans TaxID=1644129 RepID=A0ABT6MEG0_9NOCA|nr:TetR/AcrR family transcriptional regulator [Prescottella agglutinans]MDH6282707.1 TetR/AcrR family transcriptional regulator of autoinduction and epiphytic fitness [Prescottella agglutinans]